MCILAGITPCCLSYINIKMSSLLTGKTARQIRRSLSFFFLFSILWLTASANTKGTFFSCYITKTWTVYLKGCGGIAGLLDDCFCYQSIYPVKHTFDRMHFTLCNTMSNRFFLQFYTSPCSDKSSLQKKRSLTWIRLIDEVRQLIFLLYSLSGITGVRSLSTHYKFKNTF